jgi:hypothetical protein
MYIALKKPKGPPETDENGAPSSVVKGSFPTHTSNGTPTVITRYSPNLLNQSMATTAPENPPLL